MRRAISVVPRGEWPLVQAVTTIELDYEARYRRRIMLDFGTFGKALLDLPEPVILADGDGLELDDGSWVAVKAATESLLEINPTNSNQIRRIAWHLGNHHCPADLTTERIRIRHDSVIEKMLHSLGCATISVEAAFNPERGAYHSSHNE